MFYPGLPVKVRFAHTYGVIHTLCGKYATILTGSGLRSYPIAWLETRPVKQANAMKTAETVGLEQGTSVRFPTRDEVLLDDDPFVDMKREVLAHFLTKSNAQQVEELIETLSDLGTNNNDLNDSSKQYLSELVTGLNQRLRDLKHG